MSVFESGDALAAAAAAAAAADMRVAPVATLEIEEINVLKHVDCSAE